MRTILKLLVGAAVLWSLAWFGASLAISRGVDGWMADRRAEGWQAEAVTATGGYPDAFHLTLDNPAFADPETGLAWTAPVLSLSADAWAPTDVQALFPPDQTLSTPFGHMRIRSEAMTARLHLDPAPSLPLNALEADLTGALLTARDGGAGKTRLETASLRSTRLHDDPLTHDIRFLATDLSPAPRLLSRIAPRGVLPETLSELALDARVSFDAPWDLDAIERRRPQPTRIVLHKSRAVWGDMALDLAGALDIDDQGQAEGRITLRAVNWRDMVDIGVKTGVIPKDLEKTVKSALKILAGMSGNRDTIDAPLTFSAGRMSFGPIPLGPGPRFRLR